jgi:isopenicillin-N N-acyltransferase-like protein
MRVHTLAGSGTQRGLDHGLELGAEVAAAAMALKTHLAAAGHPPGPLARRLATSLLPQVAADLTPDLWSEVTALAGAARAPLEDVLLLTLHDEVWALTAGAAPSGPGCSVVAQVLPGRAGRPDIGGLDDDAVPPTPPTTEIGQTMDLPAWTQGRCVVLRIGADHAPAAAVLAYPGMIGLCGANAAGLGVAVNALTRAPSSTQGLGVAFITRHLLTLQTLAQAEEFLTSVPHAAGQAYTIAAPDGLATFEADAEGVRRVTVPGVPAIAHTNHRLADPQDERPSASSATRLDLLLAGLARHEPFADLLTGPVTVDGTRHGDPYLTLGAFRAVGGEPHARFIDGAALRAGNREWAKITYL